MDLSRSPWACEVRLQGLAQQGQRSEALDPVQPRLNLQEGQSEPSLFLIGTPPATAGRSTPSGISPGGLPISQ